MTFLRALLTVVFAGLFVVAASAQPTQGRRVALVIGNSAYAAQGTLANPGPDSRLVADALRRVGFTVTARNDLGKQAMELALRDFSRAADGAEVALIYYAGHGMEANGVNWLLPVDAQLADERDLSFEAISLDTVLGTVERARGLRMVVLDACRNNPFARSMRRSATTRATVTRGLADVEVTGTLVLYAARGGTVAQDGPSGGNSPFATAFARRVPEPGVDIRLLVSKVRDDVLAATGRTQEPFSYGSLPGVEMPLVGSGQSTSVSTMIAPAPTVRYGPPSPLRSGAVFRDCTECPEMVVVPAGTLLMGLPGSEVDRTSTSRSLRSVRIRQVAFSISEIKVSDWRAFVRATGRTPPTSENVLWFGCSWDAPGFPQAEDHPVVCLGLRDAIDYADWLSRRSNATYRLPTGAEWEYAARAGTQTLYWFGDRFSRDQAHSKQGADFGTISAMSFRPNPFGLYGVSGNASEWVLECYSPSTSIEGSTQAVESLPADGAWGVPAENCSDRFRYTRGGSWQDEPAQLMPTLRTAAYHTTRDNGLGLRLVRELPQS